MIFATEVRLIWVMCAFFLPGPTVASAQEPIVLRDLSLVRDASIADFDDQGVQLTDGRRLGWDQILKAQVVSSRQTEFDQFIERIGLPLFRLKARIQNRDWAGIREIAEPMYKALGITDLKGFDPDHATYLICVATMKGRINRGDRCGAVLPFLQAAIIQRAAAVNGNTEFKALLPAEDVERMLSSEILPIWFDPLLVEDPFKSLSGSFVPTAATDQIGAVVYLLSMAITLKRTQLSQDLLRLMESQGPEWEGWKRVMQAQFKVSQGDFPAANRLLKNKQRDLTGPTEALALYLNSSSYFVSPGSAVANKTVNSISRSEDGCANAMLDLLQIPAAYGDRFPALAAAAIYQSAQMAESLGWSQENRLLTQELLLKFPNSFHARDMEKRNGIGQN